MRGLWRRLWPRTMAGQLVVLLCCGLVAAHLIAMAAIGLRGEAMHGLSLRYVVGQAAAAYRLAQAQMAVAPQAGADHTSAIMGALDSATTQFRIGPQSAISVLALGEQERSVQRQLRRQFELPADAVRVRLDSRTSEEKEPDLHISMRLTSGAWLNGVQQPVVRRAQWRPLSFSLPVSVVPVLLIVMLFVRRILRPIKALSRAAERVSRGETIAPLGLAGPREAREVTASFNLMQERLSRYVAEHTRMLASVSHDLRSSITSLRLRAELVDDDALRAAIQRTLQEMAAMVEQTLRFASDEAKEEATNEADLGQLLNEIAADQSALGRDVEVMAAAALPATPYRCRRLYLKRALGNLVENAVRYGRCARIHLDAGGGALRILIDDDGPGIVQAQLENVFKPFVRLDPARSPETGGVGLGLAIARTCIEAHGGQLTLENRRGRGLRAVATLPLPVVG